ncbi:hypothetical protein IFR05_011280 [Cadophora sp. M221]|nr:hypothetical protein IFR05_011280 [Cadophora sp. M221]
MKARDIVLDNWTHAVGKTPGSTDLRMIGTEEVDNQDAVRSLKAAIQAQGKDFTKLDEGAVKMMPGLSNAGRTASIQKFSIIVPDDNDPTFHLVATVIYI